MNAFLNKQPPLPEHVVSILLNDTYTGRTHETFKTYDVIHILII